MQLVSSRSCCRLNTRWSYCPYCLSSAVVTALGLENVILRLPVFYSKCLQMDISDSLWFGAFCKAKVPRRWCHSDCNTTWEINSRHHRFCPLGNWVLPEGTAEKTQMNHQKFSCCARLPHKDLHTRLHPYTHRNENDTAKIPIFCCPRGHRGDFFFLPLAITPTPTPENSPQLSVLSLIFPLPLLHFSASSLCLSVSFTPISPLCPLM